jgi:hypothetical protein
MSGGSGDGGPRTSDYVVTALPSQPTGKVDLLFMIDNSISMADKQAVLKSAVPDLVRRLVVTNCVNDEGRVGATPDSPDAPCPSGYQREFTPIRDMHVGVITSSLGGHGAANCDGTTPGLRGEQENDHGHLIASRPRFAGEVSPGAQPPEAAGFLDWNPNARSGVQGAAGFTSTFQVMVTAAGEFGCGYESQLESIHRFLSDPKPYARIDVAPCSSTNSSPCAYPMGVDETLLNQRKAFLRPDSLVGVVLISDENDCSIIHRRQGYYAARADDIDLPRSTAACAANPNDPCCTSCISGTPAGCEPDPACAAGAGATPDTLDPPNLRCFNQKKRFGVDFLYPTNRYVNALRSLRLCTSNDDLSFATPEDCPDEDGDGRPDIRRNPLFDDLTGSETLPRSPDQIFLAGIIGVPWQDIQAARSDTGAVHPAGELHYLSASRLLAEGVWSKILGTPNPPDGAAPIPPTNALMIESLEPRQGNDGQGNPLAPASAKALANPVNSHEWGNTRQDDLQHACVFRLPAPRDCAVVATLPEPKPGCDCEELRPGDFSPLCQNPSGDVYEKKQHFAKAYPGLRELQVLKDFGKNAVVASICARNLNDAQAQDYGYRPAMDAIVDRMSEGLVARCLPRSIVVDPATEKLPCEVVEARPAGAACDQARGRVASDAATVDVVRARLSQNGTCGGPSLPACEALTLCTVLEAGKECHGVGAQPKAGWCYIDPSTNPDDDASLVEQCPANQKRFIRFVDPENRPPEPDAALLIVCSSSGQ